MVAMIVVFELPPSESYRSSISACRLPISVERRPYLEQEGEQVDEEAHVHGRQLLHQVLEVAKSHGSVLRACVYGCVVADVSTHAHVRSTTRGESVLMEAMNQG